VTRYTRCSDAAGNAQTTSTTITFTIATATQPSTGTGFTNVPPGFMVLTDQPWNTMPSLGWGQDSSTLDSIMQDPTAPYSPNSVLRYTYPVGFAAGSGPALEYYMLGNDADMQGRNEIFTAAWWRPSAPFDAHGSGVNKMWFVFTGNDGNPYIAMYGANDAGPFQISVLPEMQGYTENRGFVWLHPNRATVPIQLGQWYKVEWYMKRETSPRANDGIVRWWVNGQLVGEYIDVSFPENTGFTEYKKSSTWGGIGGNVTFESYFDWDHTYIATKNPSTLYPNEPAGFVTIRNHSFNTFTANNFQHQVQRGWTRPIQDMQSPLSPGGVAQLVYPGRTYGTGSGTTFTRSSGTWIPNEAVGWNVFLNQSGTMIDRRVVSNTDTTLTLNGDVTGASFTYGLADGVGPADHYTNFNIPSEIYVASGFKMSDNWQNHGTGVNKMQYVIWGDTDSSIMTAHYRDGQYNLAVYMYGSTHSYTAPNIASGYFQPNVNSCVIVPGQWHKIEWYLKKSSTTATADGIVRWWMDGRLCGEYTQITNVRSGNYIEYKIGSVWGGRGSEKVNEDYFYWDHVYISAPQ
jgi:hypothetical protein